MYVLSVFVCLDRGSTIFWPVILKNGILNHEGGVRLKEGTRWVFNVYPHSKATCIF